MCTPLLPAFGPLLCLTGQNPPPPPLPFAHSWVPVVEEVDKRFAQYEQADSQLQRHTVPDSRVHACFYLLPPCAHGYGGVGGGV